MNTYLERISITLRERQLLGIEKKMELGRTPKSLFVERFYFFKIILK
jgi:hypothetical protein